MRGSVEDQKNKEKSEGVKQAFDSAAPTEPAPAPERESRAAKVARQLREIKEMQKRRGGPDPFERGGICRCD